MPSNIVVNFMTTQHKSSVGITAAFPDVCKTPAPPAPSPVPIPYPNVGSSSMASVKVTKRVNDNKQKVVVKGAAYSMTSGDEPGVAMGVVSNKIKGKSEIMNTSFTVKFEGKGVGRLADPHGNNAGGQANAANPGQAQPPNVVVPPGGEDGEDPCEQVKKKKVPKDKRKEVAEKNGMAGQHAEDISDYCAKSGNSATFRSGNPNQVPMIDGTSPHCPPPGRAPGELGQPFPGKPMTVKNKSINLDSRPGSVHNPASPSRGGDMELPGGGVLRQSDGPDVDQALASKVRNENLEGFVGVYDKHGKLRGVRTTTGAVPIDSVPPMPSNTYVGDYDGHDFFGPDGKRITGKSGAEQDMIEGLNSAMGRDGSSSKPNMVMHGPQANYTEYCEKTGKKPIPGLQKPDVSEKSPLMAFDNDGEMYLLESEEDLANYYACKGAEPPPEWGMDKPKPKPKPNPKPGGKK